MKKYTFEELTGSIAEITEETKQDFRERIREVLMDIVDLKRLHKQNSWHAADEDSVEEAIDELVYLNGGGDIQKESVHHCDSAHCLAGHVEMDLIEELKMKGNYASDELGDTYWYETPSDAREIEYSPLIQEFVETNYDEYTQYMDGKVAFFVGMHAGLYEMDTNNLFDGDLNIANMIFNWNCICSKYEWDNLYIHTEYLKRACIECEIEDYEELTDQVYEELFEHASKSAYKDLFDKDGKLMY